MPSTDNALASKPLWISAYVSFAILHYLWGYRIPLRAAAIVGGFVILTLIDESKDPAEKYRWISIHLFGVLLAVQLGVLDLW